jgi:thymidylate synthase ThyX
MTIEAKVIADSIGPKTRRLTTFQLRYPRFIHAEFMTHRQFSRNASSSRAIPVEKQIEMLLKETAMPIHWGKNQRGMQADTENDAMVHVPALTVEYGDERGEDAHKYRKTTWPVSAESAWLEARDRAVEIARGFVEAGYHKQVVNRILEPFAHISVVVTSTQYDNFFSLRRHPDAQPEIKALADAMYVAMEGSTPQQLQAGQWHLPYIREEDRYVLRTMDVSPLVERGLMPDDGASEEDILVRASVARCARVSYLTHDGKTPSMEADLDLYDRLVGMVPLHASPAEHQATPDVPIWNSAGLADWQSLHLHGNLQGGWIQYRKTLPNECYDTWEDLMNEVD